LTAVTELIDVRVAYGDVPVLDGVTITFEEGATGLLGPNGAGKSTLIKTLLGFNRMSGGSLKIMGYAMPGEALQARRHLGYMPEKEISSPKISAVSFLTYCGRICGMSRVDSLERAHEVLNYVKMGDSRYRTMESYSTGMLQRVKLAQAILHDPRLLLLDEPTNGLDPDGRIEILDLIKEIAKRPGISVILSSHLLPDVQHVCKQVVMINNGKVVKSGTIQSLTTPQERVFELRFRDKADQCVAALTDAGCLCRRMFPADIWLTRCPESVRSADLFRIVRRCNSQIRHFQPARNSLEDIFLEAVGRK
jgi:ABC-2 type transport system ATP-binding protein